MPHFCQLQVVHDSQRKGTVIIQNWRAGSEIDNVPKGLGNVKTVNHGQTVCFTKYLPINTEGLMKLSQDLLLL